jgi:hypothetical protein
VTNDEVAALIKFPCFAEDIKAKSPRWIFSSR